MASPSSAIWKVTGDADCVDGRAQEIEWCDRIRTGEREPVGDDGTVIGLDRFGLSGPGEGVYAELGFTVDRVVDTAHNVLKGTAAPTVS